MRDIRISAMSQSLSGWDGVFHLDGGFICPTDVHCLRVAIPFRVGWGFLPFPQSSGILAN